MSRGIAGNRDKSPVVAIFTFERIVTAPNTGFNYSPLDLTRFSKPGDGVAAPLTNDVFKDDRGLLWVTDKERGLDVIEYKN